MRQLLLALALVFAFAVPAQAQADVCSGATTSFVPAGQPMTVRWMLPEITGNERYRGYHVQLDVQQTVYLTTAVTTGVCPAGTRYEGQRAYSYRLPDGIPPGEHTIKVRAWAYAVDAYGKVIRRQVLGEVATQTFTVTSPVRKY